MINFRNICGISINSHLFENLPPPPSPPKKKDKLCEYIDKMSIFKKAVHLHDNSLCLLQVFLSQYKFYNSVLNYFIFVSNLFEKQYLSAKFNENEMEMKFKE